ncbi:hypothetical protein BGX27_009997 [Mortierella sp. AM989]|nr:hypothetical protein BGX27_009997 [Mortierella sp. AM989]
MWTISDRVTPRLEEIWFEHYDPPHCNTGSSDLLLLHDILYRSYVNLKRLVIKRFPLSKAMHSSLAHDEESKQPLLGLKDLELDECEDLQEWGLPLLLQRCIALERLTLKLSDLNVIPSLITGLKATDMSNLNEIHIKAEAAWGISSFLSDIQFADIISVSQVGWKVVNIDYWLQFESLSCEALLKHSKTLEVLHMTWWESLSTSKYLLQILSSCHKLHTFSTLERHKDDSRLITYLEANEFIQSDDRSDDTIIPWPCESSLKIFKARIIDIPRPDLVVFVNGRPIPFGLNETYAGEGRYLQQQVYRRLATFVHLEELCLGGTFHEDRPFFQYNCLEMTLESGLGLLEGLKELRKLEITYMQQCIGVKDVQWMVQHWPKLRVVKGLYDQDDNLEAATWLKDHYPGIEVEVFHKKKIIFDNDL